MFGLSRHGVDSARRPRWLRYLVVVAAALVGVGFFAATTLDAAPNAANWPVIRLKLVGSDFSSPVGLVSPRDGSNRLFVVERSGLIHIIENGVRLPTPFLDITGQVSLCGECGLLGLAFPPDFAENGYFFVNYTSKNDLVGPDTGDEVKKDEDSPEIGDTVIARYHLGSNANEADESSATQILVINQPDTNHNGGQIVFGPDDLLYIGMGDGGGGGDTFQNGQDPQSLHGKILRIEIGATGTYTIPDNNPFINDPVYREEIWATGLRNPWRFGFDPLTGDLYIADVGQSAFEEINVVAAEDVAAGGKNFGWPIMEGNACYRPGDGINCNRTGLTTPVATYSHSEGCSVTGGYVYASRLPNQPRIYLYADYCQGKVWGLQPEGNGWASEQIGQFPFMVTSFGDDEAGNVYVVSDAGDIYQIVDPPNLNYLPGLFNND